MCSEFSIVVEVTLQLIISSCIFNDKVNQRFQYHISSHDIGMYI